MEATPKLSRMKEGFCWQRAGDGFLMVLTVIPAPLLQSSTDESVTAWSWLAGFTVVATGALLVRHRVPATAFLLVLGALVTAFVAAAAVGAKLSPLMFLPLAVVLYNLGNNRPPRSRAGLAVLGGGAMVLIGLGVNWMTVSSADFRGGADVLAVLAPMPLAWAMGVATRTRQDLLAAAEQRADDVTREHLLLAQQAAQQERVRIAREMHDVVAHSLTLLVVHAETLRARGGGLPDWARGHIDELASAGRQAGSELRDVLRILRDPGHAAPLRPLPDLSEIHALFDSHRAANGHIDVRIDSEVESLPRPVQLVGYRVLQESLANARRHAPGAPVRITVTDEGAYLRIEVLNTAPAHPAPAGTGTGLGLLSMRERLDVLGGGLTAGPTGDGGFRVVAVLPGNVARV